jgi:outer membrane protein assembly factor BamE (lipoprotein component of BamABCDE complex)
MKRNQTSRIARILVASSVLFGAAAAHAAIGYNVTQGEEAMIHPGMTMAQVKQELGTPDVVTHFGPGNPPPTWSYRVQDATWPKTRFDIKFGPNGKVASVDQQVYERGMM